MYCQRLCVKFTNPNRLGVTMQRGCCIRPAAKFTLSNASTVTDSRTSDLDHSKPGKLQATRSGMLRLGLVGAAGASLASSPAGADAVVVDEEMAVNVFQEARSSAVFIGDYKAQGDGSEVLEGVGSGVVWDKLGHVVTNYHVVTKLDKDKSGRQRARVGLISADGGSMTMHEARIVGLDSFSDLAVLQIDVPPEELTPIKVGTSADLKVGQSCLAIGNPFGLGSTLTAGNVSGLNRTIPSPAGRPITGAIQTDAAINAGNSGGPLLDSSGRLIGINTATFTKQGTGMSSGVNFALPVDLVYRAVPEMVLNYKIAR